jgi:hypothetical protein
MRTSQQGPRYIHKNSLYQYMNLIMNVTGEAQCEAGMSFSRQHTEREFVTNPQTNPQIFASVLNVARSVQSCSARRKVIAVQTVSNLVFNTSENHQAI